MLVKAQSYKRQWDNYRKEVAAGKNPTRLNATSTSNL